MTEFLSPITNDFRGWTWKELAWLVVGLIAVGVGSLSASPLEFAAALFNVICVILVAKGRISNYYWGTLGVILYAIVSYNQQFYGNMTLNIIYIGFQVWGIYEWRKSMASERPGLTGYTSGKHRGLPTEAEKIKYDNVTTLKPEFDAEIYFSKEIIGGKQDVSVKRLPFVLVILNIIVLIVTTYAVSLFLRNIDDPAPVLDAFTLVASLMAMTLMVKQYSEQWILWIIINVASIYMWVIPALDQPGSWSMVAMWSVFLINSLYGAWKWFFVKTNK